ncbi:hypothetical protein COCOR_06887 [Corallococcus coralloides DSM 2259]|uniref:Uncharacterized protein n=1 Tax=Corallococcus coralloides (strain ATCC 25202 / DSM 2259 / NBRC 100086 / M2) TaxID=1144275 RepID=H8N131_CORCM|nr:hypothetical protein [Corallococcus coralloides]AFE07197.1 hypothetical protein COCOR_06887 [Corallococcus coralloides DSM 2259]
MIQAHAIPSRYADAAASVVTRHLEMLYSTRPDLRAAKAVSLGESFSVWTLRHDFGAATSPEKAFTQLGYWHQIFFDGRAAGFARSSIIGDGLSLDAIGALPVVEKIDAAIDWIDAKVSGDYSARLLSIPFAHAHLFWLSGDDDRFVLIDRPIGPLQQENLYRFDEVRDAVEQIRKGLDSNSPGH